MGICFGRGNGAAAYLGESSDQATELQWRVHPNPLKLGDVARYIEAIQRMGGISQTDALSVLMHVLVKDGFVDKALKPDRLIHLMIYFTSASDEQVEEFCLTVVEWGGEAVLLQKVHNLNLSRHWRSKQRYAQLIGPWDMVLVPRSNSFVTPVMLTQMRMMPEALRELNPGKLISVISEEEKNMPILTMEAAAHSGPAETWFSTKDYPSPKSIHLCIRKVIRLSKRDISDEEVIGIIARSLNDLGKDVIQALGATDWGNSLAVLQRAPSRVARNVCKAVVAG